MSKSIVSITLAGMKNSTIFTQIQDLYISEIIINIDVSFIMSVTALVIIPASYCLA